MHDTPRRRWTWAQWVAAISFLACWVIGLSVGGPTIEPDATSEQVSEAFAGSSTTLTFAVLVHAIGAGLLVALGWSLASGRLGRMLKALAVAAAVLSLAQFVGEAALVLAPDLADASSVWQAVSRVDGIKMLVLAALIVAFHGGRVREHILLSALSTAAVIALLVSGVGYLTLTPTLMDAAVASLPLLLLWVIAATASRTAAARRASARIG